MIPYRLVVQPRVTVCEPRVMIGSNDKLNIRHAAAIERSQPIRPDDVDWRYLLAYPFEHDEKANANSVMFPTQFREGANANSWWRWWMGRLAKDNA